MGGGGGGWGGGGRGDLWIGLHKIIILSFLPIILYFLTILNNSAHYSHLVDPLFSVMLKRKKEQNSRSMNAQNV